MAKKFAVNDGKMVLFIEECEGGWLHVTSPVDPGLTTQAKSLKEAFVMAKDALRCQRAADRKLRRVSAGAQSAAPCTAP